MYRFAIERLMQWNKQEHRLPLMIRGARQVGKTWLMKEFGRLAFEQTAYVNLDNNARMRSLFSAGFDMKRLLQGLELYVGHTIDPDHTLIVLDEIQEVPQAIAALKYFQEDAPRYRVVCAGSLLGVALHEGTSFPVGKVEFLDLQPLNFMEFLRAVGKEALAQVVEQSDLELAGTFGDEYVRLLKQYMIVGGMPEVVARFAETADFNRVREIQNRILASYEQDISKHAPQNIVPRIRMMWESIPSQLAKEHKKFIYGLIKEGARAKEYKAALLWLKDCGLVHLVRRVTAVRLPLKAYEDMKAFKLFPLDVGLLFRMTNLDSRILLDGNDMFIEFKGALTELYVLQQLKTMDNLTTYYWTNDRNSAELDFLIDNGSSIIPIEVKAERNLKAKSLQTFCETFKVPLAIRTSLADYKHHGNLIDVPLWAIETLRTVQLRS